jgi:hypothetical protein
MRSKGRLVCARAWNSLGLARSAAWNWKTQIILFELEKKKSGTRLEVLPVNRFSFLKIAECRHPVLDYYHSCYFLPALEKNCRS